MRLKDFNFNIVKITSFLCNINSTIDRHHTRKRQNETLCQYPEKSHSIESNEIFEETNAHEKNHNHLYRGFAIQSVMPLAIMTCPFYTKNGKLYYRTVIKQKLENQNITASPEGSNLNSNKISTSTKEFEIIEKQGITLVNTTKLNSNDIPNNILSKKITLKNDSIANLKRKRQKLSEPTFQYMENNYNDNNAKDRSCSIFSNKSNILYPNTEIISRTEHEERK